MRSLLSPIAYNSEAIQVPSYIFLKKQSTSIEEPVDKRKCGEPGIPYRWMPEGRERRDECGAAERRHVRESIY